MADDIRLGIGIESNTEEETRKIQALNEELNKLNDFAINAVNIFANLSETIKNFKIDSFPAGDMHQYNNTVNRIIGDNNAQANPSKKKVTLPGMLQNINAQVDESTKANPSKEKVTPPGMLQGNNAQVNEAERLHFNGLRRQDENATPSGVLQDKNQVDKADDPLRNGTETEENFNLLNNALKSLTTKVKNFETEGVGKTLIAISSIVGGFRSVSSYSQEKARAIGRFNPFNLWSYPETAFSLNRAKFSLAENLGGQAMGLGGSLMMMGNPFGLVLGGALTLGGGGASVFGSVNKMRLASWEGALGVTKNIATGIGAGLKSLLDGARFVTGGLLNLSRSLIGGFTHLAGLGIGAAAAGAGLAVTTVNKTFGQDVQWNNPYFTGISLKEQLRNEHYENYWYLGKGRLQEEIVNYNRTLSKFQTEGLFPNQLPAALSGMISFVTKGREGFGGIMDMAQYIASRRTDNNWREIENWLSEQNLGIVTHIAGQILEGRSPNDPYYTYANAENAELNFRRNKDDFDAIKTGISYIFKDISNTLWSAKLPFLDITGRQANIMFANLLGSIPRALQGKPENLFYNLGNFAGVGIRAIDRAGSALDENTGLGLWQGAKRAGSEIASRTLGLADIGLEAVKTGNWTPLWDYMSQQLSDIWGAASGMITSLFDNGKVILGSLWNWISEKVKGFFNSDFPATLMQGFRTFSQWMHETLQSVFESVDTNNVKAFFVNLGYELFYAFEPAIKAIGGTIYNMISKIAGALEYMKNPFSYKKNPWTGQTEYFITKETGDLYKDIHDMIASISPNGSFPVGYTAGTNSAKTLFGRETRNAGNYTESPLLNINKAIITNDEEVRELKLRIFNALKSSRANKEEMPAIVENLENMIGFFSIWGDDSQKKLLNGGKVGNMALSFMEAYALKQNPAELFVDQARSVLENLKGQYPMPAAITAAVNTPQPAGAGKDGALYNVIDKLQQTIRNLEAQIKTMGEKMDKPLTGSIDLTDNNGQHHTLTLTQEQMAYLTSAYTLPAVFADRSVYAPPEGS
jgi:hypothetical protein